jgi:hypothetical protein
VKGRHSSKGFGHDAVLHEDKGDLAELSNASKTRELSVMRTEPLTVPSELSDIDLKAPVPNYNYKVKKKLPVAYLGVDAGPHNDTSQIAFSLFTDEKGEQDDIFTIVGDQKKGLLSLKSDDGSGREGKTVLEFAQQPYYEEARERQMLFKKYLDLSRKGTKQLLVLDKQDTTRANRSTHEGSVSKTQNDRSIGVAVLAAAGEFPYRDLNKAGRPLVAASVVMPGKLTVKSHVKEGKGQMAAVLSGNVLVRGQRQWKTAVLDSFNDGNATGWTVRSTTEAGKTAESNHVDHCDTGTTFHFTTSGRAKLSGTFTFATVDGRATSKPIPAEATDAEMVKAIEGMKDATTGLSVTGKVSVVRGPLSNNGYTYFIIFNSLRGKLPLFKVDASQMMAGWAKGKATIKYKEADKKKPRLHNYFLGRYGQVDVTKSFPLPPDHTEVRLRARFHFFDNWQDDIAYLKINGRIVWQRSHSWCQPSLSLLSMFPAVCKSRGLDVCGDPEYPDQLSLKVSANTFHFSDAIEITFGAYPKQVGASWAVDDVEISVR